MRIRLPITQTIAAELALYLGSSVLMELGGTARAGWWFVRSLECQEGTERLYAVLDSTEEPS